MICIGEGAKARGGSVVVERLVADSPDPVRLGGVANQLLRQLQPHLNSEVRATVLGHVQRGGAPTPNDRVLATQFGNEAAQLVLAGQFNRMMTLSGGVMGNVSLDSVSGRNRLVPANHPLLITARQIGCFFGD